MILLCSVSVAAGETRGKKPRAGKPASAKGKPARQLDEVRILGNVEHPGVLFFLPRAKFSLLPPREEHDWKDRILREDREKGDIPE